MTYLVVVKGYAGTKTLFEQFEASNPEKFRLVYLEDFDIRVLREDRDEEVDVWLGSWHDNYAGLIEALNKEGVKPIVFWCSPLLQMSFKPIEFKMLWHLYGLYKKGHIKGISVRPYNGMVEEISLITSNEWIIPIEYPIVPLSLTGKEDSGEFKVESRKIRNDGEVHIGLFCSDTVRKNPYVQFVACLDFARRVTSKQVIVHTNVDKETYETFHDMPGFASTDNIRLVNTGWLDDKQYVFYLDKNIDISLQVTLSEGFNYAALTTMCLGIPTVVGWSASIGYGDFVLYPFPVVDNYWSPVEIADQILSCLFNYSEASLCTLRGVKEMMEGRV